MNSSNSYAAASRPVGQSARGTWPGDKDEGSEGEVDGCLAVWCRSAPERDTGIILSVVTFEALLRLPVASAATFDTSFPKLMICFNCSCCAPVRTAASAVVRQRRSSLAAELRLRLEIQFC